MLSGGRRSSASWKVPTAPSGGSSRPGAWRPRLESIQDERFQHAIHLQREITSRRPNWPPGIALQAMLEQRQGETRRNLAVALANQGDPKMREQALALLESAPGGGSPEDARLRAVLLSQAGTPSDLSRARRIVEGLITDAGASSPADRQMLAQLCEASGDLEAAEAHWGALAKESAQPAPLVQFLLRNGRCREAVEACLQLRTPANADWAVLLTEALRRGEVDEAWESRAEAALEEALMQHPAHAELLFAIANRRLSQERIEEAIALLERVAELEPDNYPTWNNLALALAERGDSYDRALKCAERAMELAGRPVPALVDTKAVVLLRSGRAGEAAQLLTGLVRDADADDPRLHFHLALACERSEDPAAAQRALATADEQGLSEQDLTTAEREQLAGLRTRLASSPSTAISRGSE
jgi:tetratricopeptide (TPR) repeat protein